MLEDEDEGWVWTSQTQAGGNRTMKSELFRSLPAVDALLNSPGLMARVAEDAGADSLSVINTITGMAVDLTTRRPKLANVTGGLSGPAIKPVALRMVWQTAQAVKIPIIGIGGIMTTSDALEFIIAGATAIQVGTANFINPQATTDILDGIEEFLIENGIGKITELDGTLEA